MIEYTKLFELLKERNMKKTDLLQIISSPTLAKLGKGEVVKTDTIDKICLLLEVQPNDIMEVYEYVENDGKKLKVKTRLYGNNFNENEIKALVTSELYKYTKIKDGKEILDEEKVRKVVEKIEKQAGITYNEGTTEA